MAHFLNRMSPGARRAWARAYVTALNRGAAEVTIGDAIFGLYKEFGAPVLRYFKQPSLVSSLIDEIAQGATVHNYDLSKFFEGEGQVSGPSGETMIILPRLPLSSALEAVLACAEELAEAAPHSFVELGHIMRALATQPESRAILEARRIEFRDDPEGSEPEPPKPAAGDPVTLEEAIALFRDWAGRSTRVTCDFSASGSAVTSLGVNFQIAGTVGLIDTDFALVRIDGENASCLIDLRGSSIARAAPPKSRPDTPVRPWPSRIEILLATGGRCSVTASA